MSDNDKRKKRLPLRPPTPEKFQPRVVLIWLAIFAAMAPIGMSVSANTFLAHYTRELTAFVIGIFMHISTTILFESSDIHRFNLAKLGAIAVGTGLGFLSLTLH